MFGKQKTRAEPSKTTMWLCSEDARDVLCPEGYTRLTQNEEVRKCVHKVADLVSDMTIMLMKNGKNGDIRLKNSLSQKLDIYPSANMVRKNFIYKIVTDMLTTGNSVVIPEIARGGLINDLRPTYAEALSFFEDGDSYQIRYKGKVMQPDEVLHFVFRPDDEKPFIGAGIAPLIKNEVEMLMQANATKKGFLKSKWKPPLIIATEADSEEMKDPEKRRTILDSYTKTTEIGEPWLIPSGQIEVKEVRPLTLNDLAIQDSIKLDKQAVAAVVGIPAFMVGVGAFSKDEYNNFVSTTIMSIAAIIQQELTRKLLYADDMYFKFNAKSLMQYSLTEKAGFVAQMVGSGMLNRNEGRNEFDYSPVDDPEMNGYFVLENFIPVNRLGDQKKLKGGEGE